MTSLFLQGGWFMVPLTVLLLIIIAIAIYRAIQITNDKVSYETLFRHELAKIKSVGLFAFILGIFAQLVGVYRALSDMEAASFIPTAIIITGIRISFITFLYGAMIFLFSYLVWFGLDSWMNSRATS